MPFAILANVLLVLYLALYPLLAAWLMRRLSAPGSWRRTLLIPLLWTGGELVRAYLFTGFPWLAAGYSALHTPLDGLAPIGGVFLVSFVLTLVASLLARAVVLRRGKPLALAVALYGAASATSLMEHTTPNGEPFSVALIQGNIEQSTKFDPAMMERHLQDYIALAIDREEAVIILPETAFTFMEEQMTRDLEQLDGYFKTRGQTLVTGIPAGDLHKQLFYNAIITLGDGKGRYHKHHLLPFGEYVPLRSWLSIFEKYVEIPYSNFERGEAKQPPLMTGKYRAGASICYEAAFGRDMRQALPEADYLINISNDAWFKDSIAADLRLAGVVRGGAGGNAQAVGVGRVDSGKIPAPAGRSPQRGRAGEGCENRVATALKTKCKQPLKEKSRTKRDFSGAKRADFYSFSPFFTASTRSP